MNLFPFPVENIYSASLSYKERVRERWEGAGGRFSESTENRE
jgi:hypothetical protein